MKHLLTLLCIVVGLNCIAQETTLTPGCGNFNLRFEHGTFITFKIINDTLILSDLEVYKYVKLGRKVYKVEVPEPSLKEEPKGFVIDPRYYHGGVDDVFRGPITFYEDSAGNMVEEKTKQKTNHK